MTSSVVIQLLAAPAIAGPDPAPIALGSVSEPYRFDVAEILPLGGPADADGYGPWGVAVQLAPRLDGLPVDALRIVRLDPSGRVRSITGDPLPTWGGSPAARTGGATIAHADALRVAGDLVGGDPIGARLSWQVDRGVLRRVWTVERTGSPSPHGPRIPQVRIDAQTGAVLSVSDAATDAGARQVGLDPPLAMAYLNNPHVDLEPQPVKLPFATESLSDHRVLSVQQCRDLGEKQTRTTLEGASWDLHVCTPVPAAAPVDGDYLYTPDPWPADPSRDEDDFVAANVYWNVHQGFDWFEARGWVSGAEFDPRTEVTVNYRLTDLWTEQSATDPAQPLAPYRNAYFTGGYETFEGEWVAPQLVFGQGPLTDFGYDADVIHHELGHLIVASRSGPRWSPSGPYGPSIRAGALNEGLADYFSSAIHGDPLVSEYVLGDGTPIRDLEGGETCATSLIGEVHTDGLPFSGALWEVRSSLAPAAQAELDAVVVASLSVMGRNADFPAAAAAVEDLAADALGQELADALWAAFEARGIHDCPPVTDAVVGPEPFREVTVVGGSYWYDVLGPVPAPIQFRIQIPDGGAVVRLSFDQAEYLGFDPFTSPPQPLGVVGRSGADPIVWMTEETTVPYTTYGGSSFDVQVDRWTPNADLLGDGVEVSSTPHEENEQYLMRRYELAWSVAEAGPYVFQLTNAHPRSATLYDPTVVVESLVRATPGLPLRPEAPRACGCASSPGLGGLGALLALVVLARGPRRSWLVKAGARAPLPDGEGCVVRSSEEQGHGAKAW